VADPQQQMQEHFKKDPYAPLPENDGSATAEQVRKQVAEAEARHNAERAAYILRGKKIGIKSADLTRMTNHLDKQFHDQKKAIEARLETQRKERREDTKAAAANIKPRDLQRGDEEAADAGRNRQVGAGATRFVPTANARGEVTLRLPDGRSIHVDNNTYARIKDLHQQNWKEFAARTADGTKQDKQDEGAKQGIRMLVPKFIGPIGLGAASGR
jgi:hypothetical protein